MTRPLWLSPERRRPGFVSKSSPYGTVEDPFRPAELCFGARGHFFARCVATDAKGTVEVLKAAYQHKGASVTEVLQNCVIFNDHCHDIVYNNEGRKKNARLVIGTGTWGEFEKNMKDRAKKLWYSIVSVPMGGMKKR